MSRSPIAFLAAVAVALTLCAESRADTGSGIVQRGTLSAPPNDVCQNATVISASTLPVSVNGDTTGASDEGLDNSETAALADGPGGRDVFYSFTPTVTRLYKISVDPGLDLGIGIFLPGCIFSTEIAAADDTEFDGEKLGLILNAGTTYTILVEGFGPSIAGPFTLRIAVPTAPSNDACRNATIITSLPFQTVGDVIAAMDEGVDNSATVIRTGAGATDVFYRFTPETSGTFKIELDSLFDMGLGVFTGACDSLAEIAAEDAAPWKEILFTPLTAGTAYTIVAEGTRSYESGRIFLNVSRIDRPENDLCANATVIAGLPFADTVDTVAASDEGLDNSRSVAQGGGGGSDVFYRFTPAISGLHQIESISRFDSALALYTGNCGSLTETAAQDETGEGENIFANLSAGTTYTIMAEGFARDFFGSITLNVTGPTSTPTPTLTPTPVGTPCATGCSPGEVVGNLNTTYWTSVVLPDFFTAPTLTFASPGLRLAAPAPSARGSFGFFETKGTIQIPVTGTYKFTFNLEASSPITPGNRHPECRIRIFSTDGLYQRFVSTAASGAIPLRTSLPIYVEAVAGSELKIAIDLLGFGSDVEGAFTITSITSQKVLD